MYLSVNEHILFIDDKYASYSPYLSVRMTSNINKEGEDYFIIDGQNIHILNDVNPFNFNQYLLFLQGDEFILDEETFDYMLHINHLKYDAGYWKVKLQDTWIRDNFDRLELYKEHLYGLTQLDVDTSKLEDSAGGNETLLTQGGWYIAGGAALSEAGITCTSKDVDIFVTEPSINKINDELRRFGFTHGKYNKHSYYSRYSRYNAKIMKTCPSKVCVMATENSVVDSNIQVILRRYRTPSEIVHGFDVACCSVIKIESLVDDGSGNREVKFYATKRAKYCIDHKCNWFEPDRASPSYIYRLIKYATRGFEIKLPLIDDILDIGRVASWMKKNGPNWTTYCKEQEAIIDKRLLPRDEDELQGNFTKGSHLIYPPLGTHENESRDITALILMSKLGVKLPIRPISDYQKGYPKRKKITDLKWKEQNPMEQVTGTFYPKPIMEDLLEFYKRSDIFDDDVDTTKKYVACRSRYGYSSPTIL